MKNDTVIAELSPARAMLLVDVLRRLKILERRLVSLPMATINATRHADRLTIANSLESIRLDIDGMIGDVDAALYGEDA